MQRWRWVWGWRSAAAVAVALGSACGGDGDGDGDRPDPVSPGPQIPVSCGGADLTGFTSTSVVYAGYDGSATASCDTPQSRCEIQHAIDTCANRGAGACSAVLAGSGAYPLEQIQLRSGVHVIGGCQLDPAWDPRWRTVFSGPASGLPAVVGSVIFSSTRLENLTIHANNGTGSSAQPSVALQLFYTPGLRMKQLRVIAGIGANGASGSAAATAHAGQAGSGGVDGQVGGGAACTGGLSVGHGGAGSYSSYLVGVCGFDCPCTATDASSATAGGRSGAAQGGAAGSSRGSDGCPCANRPGNAPGAGSAGSPGDAGECAATVAQASADTLGTVSTAEARVPWNASQGGAGAMGGVGAGGGGGRDGGFSGIINGDYYAGHSGAGGGGGGCGGNPGGGGQQGGASFAILAGSGTALTLDPSVVLVAGAGGTGGAGAPGGAGGAGGAGGTALTTTPSKVCFIKDTPAPGSGGDGGAGGAGGAGSGGAGGNGGPSVALMLGDPAMQVSLNGALLLAGTPGPGGGGGAGAAGGLNACSGAIGSTGRPGLAAATAGPGAR